MHILTKIFVVLAALLSLLLSTLTITYSVNAERVRDAFVSAQRAKDAAETSQRVQAQNHAIEVADLQRELERRDAVIAESNGRISELQLERQTLLAQASEAEARADSMRSQVAQFGVTSQTFTELVESYRDEVGLLRDTELRSRDRLLELEERIADLTSENDVYNQTIRALREQLAEARAQMDGRGTQAAVSAPAGAAGRPAEPVSVPVSGPAVFGRIEGVQEDGAGRTLVQVNLGSNDGLRPNNELYVVRGGTYVGTLVVDIVDLQASVARVHLTASGQSVRAGDEVRTRILARN